MLKDKKNFNLLKYIVFFNGLEDHQKEVLNHSIESNHYAFDSKILAHYKMNQTSQLTLKFSERMQLRDFTYVAIGPNPYNDKEMESYSEKDIKGNDKEVTMFRGDFYMIYPIKKQIVVAFGEGKGDMLGLNSSSNTGP